MLFDSICNSQWFVKTSIILFLNKVNTRQLCVLGTVLIEIWLKYTFRITRVGSQSLYLSCSHLDLRYLLQVRIRITTPWKSSSRWNSFGWIAQPAKKFVSYLLQLLKHRFDKDADLEWWLPRLSLHDCDRYILDQGSHDFCVRCASFSALQPLLTLWYLCRYDIILNRNLEGVLFWTSLDSFSTIPISWKSLSFSRPLPDSPSLSTSPVSF